MIDVKKTITSTIKDVIDKMRFVGEQNPQTLKKVMTLVVIDDIYDWAGYLDQPQKIQKFLRDLRTRFIINNRELIMERAPEHFTDSAGNPYVIKPMQPYTNVNTPQNNDTWKRVWDAPEWDLVNEFVKDPEDTTIQHRTEEMCAWEPDYNCSIEIKYFSNYDPKDPEADVTGEPKFIDPTLLSICEKMNIYINRDTKEAFYLATGSCEWEKLESAGMNEQDVIQLIKDKRPGIKAIHYDVDGRIIIETTDFDDISRDDVQMQVTNENDINELLDEE